MKIKTIIATIAGIALTHNGVLIAQDNTPAPMPAPLKVEVPVKSLEQYFAELPKNLVSFKGGSITAKDLETLIKPRMAVFFQRAPLSDEKFKQTIDGALKELVTQKLILIEAKNDKISISNDDVTEKINGIKDKVGKEKFAQQLKSSNLTEKELFGQISDALTVEKWLKETVFNKIEISDKQVKKFYDENRERYFKKPEMVEAAHILIKVARDASAEDKEIAKKKCEDVLKKLNDGAKFADLAKEFSACPSGKRSGGSLGAFGRKQMDPAFEKVAFALKMGETSEVVESSFGFHIIKTTKKMKAGIVEFAEAKESIKQFLTRPKVQSKVKDMEATLRKKYEVKITI